MLTGCRRNEILTLRWEDAHLKAGELLQGDTQTGARQVARSPAARRVLAAVPRLPDNPWVIAGARPGTRLSNLNNAWLAIRAPGRAWTMCASTIFATLLQLILIYRLLRFL